MPQKKKVTKYGWKKNLIIYTVSSLLQPGRLPTCHLSISMDERFSVNQTTTPILIINPLHFRRAWKSPISGTTSLYWNRETWNVDKLFINLVGQENYLYVRLDLKRITFWQGRFTHIFQYNCRPRVSLKMVLNQ